MTTDFAVFRAEDINPEWLTQMLRDNGFIGAQGGIREAHWQPFGTGQSGESVRINLIYGTEERGPASLVAKFASASEEARAFANAAGMYEREVRFYNELARQVPVRAPVSLHASLNPSDGRFVLLMEDMAQARVVDQLEGCSPDEAALAMEQAAALHAGSWRSSTLADADWLRGTQVATSAIGSQFPQFLAAYIERYGEAFGADAIAQAEEMSQVVDRWIEAASETWCLWHQDFRSDNMLFDACSGTVPLAIVDWQTIGMGRGMSDIAYFLGTSLTTEVRRREERRLVEHYHRELLAHGVSGYDFDSCWLHYRQNAAQGVFTVVHASVRAARTERGDRMWHSWATRTAAQACDHDTFALLRAT